jgi:tetratricopeptide (TPR) repeat protein
MNLFKPPLIDNIAREDESIRQDIRNIESNPNFESWKKLATSLFENEYYDHAKYCYDKAVELNPNDIDSWYNRGLALNNLGRNDEANARLIEVEGKYHEAAAEKYHEAAAEKYHEAAEKYHEAAKKYHEAILCYDKVININPNNINAWNSKGYTLRLLGKFREAIRSYDRVIEIDASNVSVWYNRGLALSNLGRYDEAIRSYDRVIEIDANNTDAFNAKGLVLERLGKYDEAAEYYNKVREIDKIRVQINNEKGNFLQESRKFREAIRSYDRVIEIDASNVSAWYNRGLALSNLGRYDEAIRSYDRVIEIDANNTDAFNAKGLVLERLGKYDEAILSYHRVLDIDANNSNALYNEANLCLSLGKSYESAGKSYEAARKYHEAINVFNCIIAFDSNNIPTLESLRQLYSNYTFEFDKSLLTAKKLFDLQPDPERKTMLAEDFIKIGKYKKGRELALEVNGEIQWEKIKGRAAVAGQCTIRLIILASYLLEDDSAKGNKELLDFLNYYKELKTFKIEENEWNFNGLIKAINDTK